MTDDKILTQAIAEKMILKERLSGAEKFTAIEDAAAESLSRCKESLYLNGLTSLSDAAAESLSRSKKWLALNGLTEVSDAAAESLGKHKDVLLLNGLTSLSDAAAENLSKHAGRSLSLRGLTSLSDAAAESFSKHKEELDLYGLTSLSDATAESFSKHTGDLCLGLTTLSDAAAESLSKCQNISLMSLSTLSDSAAESFSKYKGDLNLYGLTSLSDAAAERLSKHLGKELDLRGLTSLSDAAAESFSKHKGDLSLNGLTTLSDAAAENLSKHEGGKLSLYDLSKISDAAAESLAKKYQDGLISLDLDNLPESAVKILKGMSVQCTLTSEDRDKVRHLLETVDSDNVRLAISLLEETASDGDLEDLFTEELIGSLLSSGDQETFTMTIEFLQGRKDAWEQWLEELAKRAFQGVNLVHSWSLSDLLNLPEELAECLNWSDGILDCESLTSLSDEAAEFVSRYEPESDLNFHNLTELSDAAAESLGKYKGYSLSFDSITSLSAAAAESLGHPVDTYRENLYLNGLTSLPEAVAEGFRHLEAELHLNGLTSLSAEAAEALNGESIRSLHLDGLSSLSDEAAQNLVGTGYSGRPKPLDINLDQIPESAAKILFEGVLNQIFSNWESFARRYGVLTEEIAEQFLEDDSSVHLSEFTAIEDAAAESLSGHEGDLELDGITFLSDAAANSLSKHEGEIRVNLDALPKSAAKILRDAGMGD